MPVNAAPVHPNLGGMTAIRDLLHHGLCRQNHNLHEFADVAPNLAR